MGTRRITGEQGDRQLAAILGALAVIIVACVPPHIGAQAVRVDPASMPGIATVDERFASYNVEMAEVIGGNFWVPYSANAESGPAAPSQAASSPVGMNPNMYQYRPSIDLSNPRLLKLAAALGPAYVRVSGTWANSVYFADSDTPPQKAPAGYSGVLTRKSGRVSSISRMRSMRNL